MKSSKLPSLKTIQEVKKKYTVLLQRTSPQIKTWLHNKQKALRQQCEIIILIIENIYKL